MSDLLVDSQFYFSGLREAPCLDSSSSHSAHFETKARRQVIAPRIVFFGTFTLTMCLPFQLKDYSQHCDQICDKGVGSPSSQQAPWTLQLVVSSRPRRMIAGPTSEILREAQWSCAIICQKRRGHGSKTNKVNKGASAASTWLCAIWRARRCTREGRTTKDRWVFPMFYSAPKKHWCH